MEFDTLPPGISFSRRGQMSRLFVSKKAPQNLQTIILKQRTSLTIELQEGAAAAFFTILTASRDNKYEIAVRLAAQSRLSLVILSEPSRSKKDIRQNVRIGAGAMLELTCVIFGKECDHSLESHVEGKGGESRIHWIGYANDGEEHRVALSANFLAPKSRGDIAMRGIAEGTGILRMRGNASIGRRAKHAEVSLSQRALMLNSAATVETIPQLEIHTDDVRARHSASVANVSEEDLFYLTSRGLSRAEARMLCIEGFLNEFLEPLSEPTMQKRVRAALKHARASSLTAPGDG